MTTSVVWFRRDLRLHDHPALTAAHADSDRIAPLFAVDERLQAGRLATHGERRLAWAEAPRASR